MKRLGVALVMVCLLVGLVVATAAHSIQRQQIDARRRAMGQLLVGQVILTKHWEAFESQSDFLDEIRALVTDFKSQDYQYLTIGLPGRPDEAGSPKQTLDEFEQQLLDRFTRPASEKDESSQIEYVERLTADGTEYQYYQPIRAQKSCLSVCHREYSPAEAKPLAEGQPMAVMRITIPIQLEP